MVGCDGCDDWFHFTCMRIPEQYKDLVFSFYCPYCQAGVTGPASTSVEHKELPRTIWKRKCRLHNCFKECKPNSKYCCEEHGEQYMRQVLSKLRIDGMKQEQQENLVLRMAKYTKTGNVEDGFQKIGNPAFIEGEVDKSQDPELYSSLIANDERMEELRSEDHKLGTETIPNCKQAIEHLNNYLDWLNKVNSKLFAEDVVQDDINGKNRKKKSAARKKQKNAICGYNPTCKPPLTVDEFAAKYDPEKASINGTCTKLRCNKHNDWSTMLMQQYTNKLRSLQNHQERIALLLSTRKSQLHIQYYERLLRRKT